MIKRTSPLSWGTWEAGSYPTFSSQLQLGGRFLEGKKASQKEARVMGSGKVLKMVMRPLELKPSSLSVFVFSHHVFCLEVVIVQGGRGSSCREK